MIVRYDEDGDSATAGSGSLLITVQDDVSIATHDFNVTAELENQAWWSVSEGGNGDNVSPDYSTALSLHKTTGNLLDNDLIGADNATAEIHSFTYKNENGTVLTGTIGQWVNTQYGAIKVMADGTFQYISDPFSTHTTTNFLNEDLTYTIQDADGDLSTAVFKIKIIDTEPDIKTPAQSSLYEKNLPEGSDPNATETVKTEDITFTQGADPKEIYFDYRMVTFAGNSILDINLKDITTSIEETDRRQFSELKSKGRDLTYTLSSDKRTLTASTTSGNEPVFTVEILGNQNFDGTPEYRFTLYQPLDHIPDPGTELIPSTEIRPNEIDLMFDLAIWDNNEQLDKKTVQIPITIYDDNTLPTPKAMTVVEDSPTAANTITTSADATSSNTSVPAKGDTDGPKYGTAVVNANGTITYTPDGDYSGADSFVYTHIDEDGSSHLVTVSVTVTPVSDAPIMADTSAETQEDKPVALGLVAPAINDSTDQNSAAVSGDDSERFGLITLGGIPDGAQLLKSDGTVLFTGTAADNDVTIRLTDGLSMNGIPVADLTTLDTADFNALMILPPPDSNVNFTVTMSVTEYEVDGAGNQKSVGGVPVPGVTKTVNDVITVKAVTDRVDLQWKTTAPDTTTDLLHPDSFVNPLPSRTIDSQDSYIYTTLEDGTLNKWIAEDSTFNLKSLLEYTAVDPSDINNSVLGNPAENTGTGDTSETRYIVLSNLPVGTVVNGTTIGDSGTISIMLTDGKTLPDINLMPPKDFSGDLKDIKVTLTTIDQDSTWETGLIVQEEDFVMLNLYVKPVADDIASPDVSTPEDTRVQFLLGLVPTDTSTDPLIGGKEVITGITIKALPAGWKLYDEGGVLLTTGSGADYTIDSDDVTIAYTGDPTGNTFNYQYYTILPPGHSSADIPVLSIEVTSTDTSDPDGDGTADMVDTRTVIHEMKVTVTPVAEVIGTDSGMDGVSDDLNPVGDNDPDSDGNLSADLRMNPSHDYGVVTATEDEWFKLHRVGIPGDPDSFDLKTPWSNEDTTTLSYQDNSEKTYALFTPEDSSGNELIGSRFRYNDGSSDQIRMYSGTPIEVPIEFLDTLEFKPPAHFAEDDIRIIVNAKTVDTDQDPGGTVNTRITGEVVLTLDVTPVADDVTLAVTSPVGVIEDNERPLSIRPTSSDKDGSENFWVVISEIPDGSRMTYNGNVIYATTATDGYVIIENFDSSLPLTILPPLHSNVDFDLSVTAYAVESDALVPTGPVSQTLTITVDITGDADGVTVGVQPKGCVEELVDQYGCQIPMSQVINSVAPIDTDGSESVSGYFTGLPEGFDIVGTNVAFLGGEGTSRRWVLTPDDLSGTYLSVPENYSGTVTFNGIPVTTENDGDTWTGPVLSITKTVTPSPEATIVTSTSFNEDQFVRVDFDIEYQNGDTDEVLESVWIKASDVDSKSFTLYYDADDAGIGSPIAFGQPGMVADSDGYYKLTGEQSEHIYVQNEHDVDGTYNFEIQYAIKDPTSDGTTVPLIDLAGNPVLDTFGAPVLVDHITVWTTDSYMLQVNAVTDPIDATLLSITPDDRVSGADSSVSGNTVTVFGSTMLEVKVMVGQRDDTAENPGGKDIDESEVLQRFVIDGVPDGISVVGGTYIGDTDTTANTGRWIIDVQPDAEFDNNDGIEQTIFFNIDGTEDQLASSGSATITITAESRDMGSNPPATVASGISTASTSFTVKIDPAFVDDGAVYAPPAEITSWQFDTAFNATEDTSSSLADLTNAAISDSGNFSITLKNIPDGTIVSGMERTVLPGGEVVYTASGTGDNADLQTLLHSITLTPPANRNENNFNDQFAFDLTLTTYAEGAQQNVATFHAQPEVYPVSDPTAIVITPRGIEGEDDVNPGLFTDSGEDVQFTVSFRNDEDYGNTELVGDLMLTITDSGMDVHSGVLLDGSNSVITPDSVGADYAVYKISGVSYADSLTFTYVPVEHSSGSVRIDASMDSKETPLSDPPGTVTLPAIGATTIDVIPVIDGYRVDSITASGNEDTRIKVVLVNPGLVDTDGSESVQSILLENVPNGYMVYIINDATGEKLALNAGDDGLGHNTWSLGSTMPSYIAIQPPKNVSGTVDNISLSVYTIEDGLDTPLKQSFPFDLEVLPVVDGLTINPTHTFGIEGELIPINLNASMADFDGSETATVTLQGLGRYARFFGDGSVELTGVSYEESTDTYTLSGLTVADTNALSFIQSARVIGTPGVTVTAVTYENGSTTPSTTVSGSFTLDIAQIIPTTTDDTLLYDGMADVANTRSYDGLAGEDTLVLRKGEGIDFDTDRSIFNIERIDLTVSGDHILENITWQDVRAMTDSSTHDLYILGDSGDSVKFEASNGWSKDSPAGSFDEYSNTNDSTIKVYVQKEIVDSIV
ncbi:MAG: cadherin-like domain-containing protein [Chlorobium sp.]|uniref:Ig-like domain-containing protein n=1 Tax=Chlorobium sp. TaxID=1095 RepID=UPI002F3FCB41